MLFIPQHPLFRMVTMCSWNLKDAIRRNSPRKVSVHPRRIHRNTEVTNERLNHSYRIAAIAVSEHGDKYLSIFERLHVEVENNEKKNTLLNAAFNIARDKDSHDHIR